MNAIVNRIRAELGYWGTRLNLLAVGAATYAASNGSQIQSTVNSLVPEKWRPLAIGAIGLAAFLIVNAAAQSDRQKVAGQWQR